MQVMKPQSCLSMKQWRILLFNFSKISEEELKIVGGKDAVTEKYKKTVRAFTPEY